MAGVEQLKSTTVVSQSERYLVLTDADVSKHCHDVNLDVTENLPNHQDVEEASEEPDISGNFDPATYNLDVHENDAQRSPLGSLLTDEPDANDDDGTLLDEQHSGSGQIEETERNTKITDKIFILHFTKDDDKISQDALLHLASSLRRFHVDVTLDLFEKDTFSGNWNRWYERELKESRIVLCIITEDFDDKLSSDRVKGYSAYNLMSDENIPFVPVFLGRKVNESHIPLSMRGSNIYSIMPKDIPNKEQADRWSERFKSLYSFLTTQNRAQPPDLGKMVEMPRHPSVMSETEKKNLHQGVMTEVEKKFLHLKTVTTPVMSLSSHNKMFMQLASNMTAEWEALGRMLGVSEANMYAIKRDNMHSVTEQAVKMFQQWLRQNGSRATIEVLATAVHKSGSKYWELLEILNKHAS